MKEQFAEGSFGSVSVAVSVVEQKMVMIKKLRGLLRKLLAQITEFKMLQTMGGWPFVPKFIGAFQVNFVGAAFIFEHEDVLDLREKEKEKISPIEKLAYCLLCSPKFPRFFPQVLAG